MRWGDAPNLSRLLGAFEESQGWQAPAKVCANCKWVRPALYCSPYWGVYCSNPEDVARAEHLSDLITDPMQRDATCWEASDDG
jgi:hypothetical protein